jgi:hypothetical protein
MIRPLLATALAASLGLVQSPAAHATEVQLATRGASNPQAAIDLSGTWAQRWTQTAVSRVPVVGRVRTTTETLLLLTIEQHGDALSIDQQVCAIDVSSGSGVVRTIIPDAFVDALPTSAVEARLDLGGTTAGIRDWQSVDVVGAALTDASNDALPTDANDVRVLDPDADGHPGMTVLVRGMVDGEVYVVQRGQSELRTSYVSSERIEGVVDWTAEQVVLGASARVLRNSPPTEPDPDPARNRFVTVRLDAGATCSTVLGSSTVSRIGR